MAARRLRNAQQRQTIEEELLQHESGDCATGGGALRIAIAYPNAYGVGMASLGFQRVRRLALESGLARVERAFADPIPGRSLEFQTPLGDFDLILFSVAFEPDYPNILSILDAAGIPLMALERDASHPLIVAGGPAILVNRHGIAPFVDVLVHGDAEETIRPFLERAADRHPRDGEARKRLLADVGELPGVEAPSATGLSGETNPLDTVPNGKTPEGLRLPEMTPVLCDAPARAGSVSDIVTPHAEFGRRILVEIARGCPHRCPFCWMGCQRRKPVTQSAKSVLAMVDAARGETGCNDAGLIASAIGAHPEIGAICAGLRERGIGVSFASLRAEELRPEMLQALVEGGQRGITLAPETGDEALRRTLGKNLPDSRLYEVIDEAQRIGLEGLKLYFMVGLPGESDEAVAAIPRLVAEAREILLRHGRPRGRVGDIGVNLGVYVPKPGTPMGRRPRPHPDATSRRLGEATRALRAMPNVRVAATGMEDAAAQTVLANGGLEAADLVYGMWQSGKRPRGAVKRYLRRRPDALEVAGFEEE